MFSFTLYTILFSFTYLLSTYAFMFVCFSSGGPNYQRPINVDMQLDGDACQEAISLLKHTSDTSLIFQKMRETFQHRQKVINDPDKSLDILSIFPRFLDTKGLVRIFSGIFNITLNFKMNVAVVDFLS